MAGALAGWQLYVGTAQDPELLGLVVAPSASGFCHQKYVPGRSRTVTVDGVRVVLRTIPARQDLAFCQPVRGLAIDIRYHGSAGVITLARHLQLFGADVASWTAHPIG